MRKTITANTNASPKENSGPAMATMILSSGETAGMTSRGVADSPSMASIGAICGSLTNPPNGIDPRL